jgi:hypothetical protein
MSDLTVIFLTENTLPKKWMRYQRKTLLKAVGSNNLITISRKPLKNMGLNLIQKKPRSLANIYWQILRGAKSAKTEYVAVAEDDTLYPESHFKIRPRKNVFAYNASNWKIYNWGKPIYHSPTNMLNYVLIASRELVIKTLERRFTKGFGNHIAGELGKEKVYKRLGIRENRRVKFWTVFPVINVNHDKGFDPKVQAHIKPVRGLRVYDVPYWGRAEDIMKKFA